MPIRATDLRELMLRGENETLDFKREHHTDDADLAKDLMSIANRLRKTAEPGYLLIGIDEDEHGRGKLAEHEPVHPDDAPLQQKARNYLNPPIEFHFYIVPLDGFAVGVFEIRYSKRPITAARSSGNKLVAGLAYLRRGTRNDLATAHEVVGWAREDHLLDNEAALLAVDQLRVQVVPSARIYGGGFSLHGDHFDCTFHVLNQGNVNFGVDANDVEASFVIADEIRTKPVQRREVMFDRRDVIPMTVANVAALGGAVVWPKDVAMIVMCARLSTEEMFPINDAYRLYRTTPILRVTVRVRCRVGTSHVVDLEGTAVLQTELPQP